MTPPELFDLRTKLERLKVENILENRELQAIGDAIITIGDVILRMGRADKWKAYVERSED